MTPADVTGRRSTGLVAAGILVSRLTGLVRERALAHYLGAGGAADAFTVAFRIPNLLQHLLGEGVLSASFIPVYSRLLAQGRHRDAGRVASAVLGLLLLAAGGLTLLGVLLAEPLTVLVAAGLRARPEVFDLTVDLVRIMFFAVGLLVVSAWCLGVLNSHGRFFLSYVAPALFNAVQVVTLVVAAHYLLTGVDGGGPLGVALQEDLVRWLGIGTVVGGAVQLAVQLPAVVRLTRGLRPVPRVRVPGVPDVLRAFGPVVAAKGVVQISTYLQVLLASFLAAGALATLRYAQVLYMLPISLFGMAVAAAALPRLSAEGSTDTDDAVARERTLRRVDAGLGRVAALVVPTATGYLVVGDLVTATLFQTGAFGRLEVLAVWLVLAGFTVGLVATTSGRLLQAALFATGDTRVPAVTATVRVVVSLALGAVLMLQLDRLVLDADGLRVVGDLPAFTPLPADERDDVAGLVRLGAVGIALASGVAAWVELVLLRRAVGRRLGRVRLGGGQLGRIVLAAVAAAVVLVPLRPLLLRLPPELEGVVAIVLFALVYLPVARLLGVREVMEVLAGLARRLRRRV
ncbi:murein biosynthesis integral membrane protein MurJ [Aquipuribacter nitratireducens]|uniref:Probable lipid II flippase MurJ n=1 Tax=Aquipuribacter nitratireducens TaxID=650104 RepID=A0ABW0GNX4_9MICO